MTRSNQEKTVRAGGRKRDASRDKAILDAAISVVAEVGYVGLTMDAVASRAGASKATLYRRWDSKTALILDAMAKLQDASNILRNPPNTGNLRDDLIMLFFTDSDKTTDQQLRVLMGLVSVIAYEESVAELGDTAIIAPWATACRTVIERAAARGEVSIVGVDVDLLSRVIPSMAVSHTIMQRRIADREFLTALVDGVLLPALGVHSASL